MTTITVGQHVYANVEPEESPRRRGGFQTLYATPDISERDLTQIEARMAYTDAEGEPVKRFFFPIEGGKFLIGQIVPVSDRDAIGRTGRYIGHSAVLSRAEFAKVGNDPFAILERSSFAFAVSMEEAMRLGDSDGRAPTVTIEVSPPEAMPAEAREWDRQALAAIVPCAARLAALGGREMTVLGAPNQVEQVLSLLVRAIPSHLRTRCSFDSYASGASTGMKPYWAVGQMAGRGVHLGTVIDAAAHKVLNVAQPEDGQQTSSYERWLQRDIERNRLLAFTAATERALAVSGWLDGQLDGPPPTAPDDLLATYARECPREFDDRIAIALRRTIGGALAQRIMRQPGAPLPRLDVYTQLGDDAPVAALAPLLWKAYLAATLTELPQGVEAQELKAVVARCADAGLAALDASIRNDLSALRASLTRLSEPDYRDAVEWFTRSRLVFPWCLILPGRAHPFLDAAALPRARADRDLPRIVQELIDTGQGKALPRVASLLDALNKKNFATVQELAQKLPQRHAFRTSVRREEERRRQEGGVRGWLQKK